MKNIAIIGAGITGITTAYQLLERGYNVSVFDKNRYAAMETSFANGGQLSAEAWTPLRLPGTSCRACRVARGGAALLTCAAAVEVRVVAVSAIEDVVAIPS